MPRVANPPRPTRGYVGSPQKQSPLKIPLNDDRQEKAVRLQSRQALHDLQMNQIKTAASPMRKISGYERATSSSPHTPQNLHNRGKENVDDGGLLAVVSTNTMTPMKRVPILANFEEWMKMATDNKINATNSWNFALIDYFHDMSLLKEGNEVNFQMASCTLDGCVKIYTSRVDSVATETGKLLSGLADSGNKRAKHDNVNEEEEEEGEQEEGDDGSKKRTKKRAQRSSEATLAPSFASLQLKKFELEFSVDPLFKKASADFDEGGAKGLLLNHLAIDGQGRIVFDSSDDAAENVTQETETHEGNVSSRTELIEDPESSLLTKDTQPATSIDLGEGDADIDLAALASTFFPDLNRLDEQNICTSLKNFDLGDPMGTLDIPFLKAPEDPISDQREVQLGGIGDKSGMFLDDDNAAGFDDDGVFAGFDIPLETGFGEGGEAWVKEADLEPRDNHMGNEIGVEGQETGNAGDLADVKDFHIGGSHYGASLRQLNHNDSHEGILGYFDNALKKNWAGPEHWKIRRIRDAAKASVVAPSKRKEKEPFEIDFLSPLDSTLAELIYTPATSNSAISLPKTQRRSKTRNLLPDDKHFNSRQLLQLFLKPRASICSRKGVARSLFKTGHASMKQESIPEGEINEAFWARQEGTVSNEAPEGNFQANYDANFFQDDNLAAPGGLPDDDEEDFADAREAFSPGIDGPPNSQGMDTVLIPPDGSQAGAFGTQLVTQSKRLRPEYVQYAKVAKKVDVRRLKEEMWKGIGFGEIDSATAQPLSKSPAIPSKSDDTSLKFTSVMNSLQQVYPKQAMADISTSYCFICLLHLANEKGLTLENENGLEELSIRKDHTAEITEGVE